MLICLKINNIWNKASNNIEKELDCEPIYDKRFLNTKLRSYIDVATNFHTRKIPEAGSNYIF